MEDWVAENLDKAAEVAALGVCDHCLGRMFAKCGTKLTDLERGRMLRAGLAENGRTFERKELCPLCENLFDMVPRFADAIIEKIAETESENFLIGCKLDPVQTKTEKQIVEDLGLGDTFEPLKTELNREIGKVALPSICRRVEMKEPQVVACIDTRFAEVSLDI